MKFLKVISAILMMATVSMTAFADVYPNKPVRVIMPYPAGTGPDSVMRFVGERLAKTWGQQVLVDNRPGGNGWIGVEAVKRSPADGYTILLVDQAIMSLHPYLYKKMPFDAVKDFEPTAPMYSTNYFITVSANAKWKNYGDMIADAKSRSAPLSYGSSGVGGQLHIGGALVEAGAGIPMNHVPYRDIPQMYVDVSQSNVDFAFATAATAGPLVKAGKIKYLAFAGLKRHPRYPDIPTVAESGGSADVQVSTWIAMFTPAGTPPDVVKKINADVAKIIATPEAQEFLAGIGMIGWSGTAKELSTVMKSDAAGYSDFVKKFKISVE